MAFLLKPFISIFLNGASLYFLTKIVTEVQYTGGITFFIVGGVVLGILNFIVKPLLKLLALPLRVLTLGLFTLIINAFVLYLFSYILEVAAFQDVTVYFPSLLIYIKSVIVLAIINYLIHLID
jgi:putative membrane protein